MVGGDQVVYCVGAIGEGGNVAIFRFIGRIAILFGQFCAGSRVLVLTWFRRCKVGYRVNCTGLHATYGLTIFCGLIDGVFRYDTKGDVTCQFLQLEGGL